ncbi:hypothetical protein CALCODRAFT_352227 [Calocera cornea HHB12733]|uniref:Uncharacterized protein n=1 Tax=Calocera cornea HHB12733 TaxID=1353952 RepID=A0A165ET03_9BASI|nr:hypothetical protein CALCODRAFT_352227 [Calocera cornea HHB12733]
MWLLMLLSPARWRPGWWRSISRPTRVPEERAFTPPDHAHVVSIRSNNASVTLLLLCVGGARYSITPGMNVVSRELLHVMS